MRTQVAIVIILFGLCKLSLAQNQKCLTDSDCNNGICRNFTCICNSGFVTFGSSTCNYQQKEKLTAFLLSFFVGSFGADW